MLKMPQDAPTTHLLREISSITKTAKVSIALYTYVQYGAIYLRTSDFGLISTSVYISIHQYTAVYSKGAREVH